MTLLAQKCRGPFYDPWEALPEEKRRILIGEALDEYVRFTAESIPWYRERLEGFDAKSETPLKNVPVLTASMLRELVPPVATTLVTGGIRDYTVFQSGGTTGFPKTTLFGHAELERLNLPNARGFYACGLEASDRVANHWAVGGLYMTFMHINRMLQQYGCMNFPFSNHTEVDFVHTVVKLFQVNVLTGIGSVVMNVMRGMADLGLDGIRIEKIFYGGEHLYEADKREIATKLGATIIRAPGYGTVDTWYLGYQCAQTPTGVFHAHDDESYLEIIDEESGRHCAFGEVGMLHATAFPRRIMPVIRYRVGDRAAWLSDKCPCGRTTPLFRLYGRGDDVLRIGYDSIDYQAVQDAVLRVPGLSGSVQMEKQRKEGRDQLIVRVETELPSEERPKIAARLAEEITEGRPSFRDFVAKGTTWPLQIELVAPESLPRNPRTGKLMRVVDAIKE